MSSDAERLQSRPKRAGHVPVAELARRQGVKPIKSVDELARPDLFDSEAEFEEFLADLYASRRADMA